jgi:prepilin-type N-terminal cleavage/methylation domain-containing protein
MKLLTQAQSSKGTRAQRNKNSVPVRLLRSGQVCLSAYVPNRKGMTLLEMAIAMAILAIALVALANLFPIGLRASRRAVNYSESSLLAQRLIENMKLSASIDDAGDGGYFFGVPGDISDGDGIGYFELVNQYEDAFPFKDDDLTDSSYVNKDATGIYSIYRFQYDNTDMWADVKSVDWDANGNSIVGREMPGGDDWDDVLLSQKVYVAVYWSEADQDRAETFIAYISNPFYEKYK